MLKPEFSCSAAEWVIGLSGTPGAAPWSSGMRLWLLVLGVRPRRWCWIWCQDKEVPYLNLLCWLQDLKCQPMSARYFLRSLRFWGLLVVTLIYQWSSETPVADCHLWLAMPLCPLIWLKPERTRVGFCSWRRKGNPTRFWVHEQIIVLLFLPTASRDMQYFAFPCWCSFVGLGVKYVIRTQKPISLFLWKRCGLESVTMTSCNFSVRKTLSKISVVLWRCTPISFKGRPHLQG